MQSERLDTRKVGREPNRQGPDKNPRQQQASNRAHCAEGKSSATSWRRRRRAPAPSAMRMAISRERALARAIRRTARLMQPIKSRHPAAAISANNVLRTLKDWLSASGQPVLRPLITGLVRTRVFSCEAACNRRDLGVRLRNSGAGSRSPDREVLMVHSVPHFRGWDKRGVHSSKFASG